MNDTMKNRIWLPVIAAAFLASAVSQTDGASDAGKTDSAENAFRQMELLTEALLQIKKHYVEERTYEQLIHGALSGMLNSLDPHSSFLEPEEYEDLLDDTSGKYGGIGIHIGLRDGVPTVIAPIEDTPAFRAGLQSGDRIIEIEGASTVGIALREAVGKLRGPKGAKVVVTIMSPGEADPRQVEMVRDVIEVASIKGTRIVMDGIAYVRVTQFAQPTAGMLLAALEELSTQGMKGLVLDLRGNPGGLLMQAVQVADIFLARGQTVVLTQGRQGADHAVTYSTEGDSRYSELPLAILINSGSASASEIVAGAVQDNRRGVLVGQTTFGKGSVQSVIRSQTDGASAIRLTTAYYYTPGGRMIHNRGIDPDIQVEMSRDTWRRVQVRRAYLENPELYREEDKSEFMDAVDVQLQRAVDLLQAILILNHRDGA